MQTVSAQLVADKNVLLRYDFDVPLKKVISDKGQETSYHKEAEWEVEEDFRLRAGLETLRLCLEHAHSVTLMGHLGRPHGIDPKLSVKPIVDWLKIKLTDLRLTAGKLNVLENLRFEEGEDTESLDYAKQLASLGDPGQTGTGVYINEAFAAYHHAASTTVLPTLLPHAAGLNFSKEVNKLTEVRQNPKRPLVAIIGGAKIEDKYSSVVALSKIADAVLVGGLLPKAIKEQNLAINHNVILGSLNESGLDISLTTVEAFANVLAHAKQVIWAGPMGRYEETGGQRGTESLAKVVIESGAESIIGGGDTVAALDKSGLLDQFDFVSTGGGAMLKFLEKGTLETIEALS